MKLSYIIEQMIKEAEEGESAEQAHKLGLTAKPYGNWADQSGNVVAKTVQGQLVKIEPGQEQGGEEQPTPDATAQTTPSPEQVKRGRGRPAGSLNKKTLAAQQGQPPAPVPNQPDAQGHAPDDENFSTDSSDTDIPTVSTALERMLAAAGGDSNKLRKTLVNKFRKSSEEGNAPASESTKKWLAQLDAHDAEQKASVQRAIQAVADRQATALAAKKAKYSQLYPSPDPSFK